MEKITYEKLSSTQTAVYLPSPGNRKKRVGVIFARKAGPGAICHGFQYVPLGKKKGGDIFKTLEACKRSLETDSGPKMTETQAVNFIAKNARYYGHGVPLPGGTFGGKYAVEWNGQIIHAEDTQDLRLLLQGKDAL